MRHSTLPHTFQGGASRWPFQQLRRLLGGISSGTSVNAEDLPVNADEIGVLKTSCVYSGNFDPSQNKRVVPEDLARVACPVIAQRLVVSRMNTPDLVGAAGLVKQSQLNLFLPDRLWLVEFDEAVPDFVYWWTQTKSYRDQVKTACAGTSSSMQNLSLDEFRRFQCPVPPLAEQRAIAGFLDRETAKIDALVAEQRRLIALLKEKRQAVISHAVTKGLDPAAPMKPSGIDWLGDIPAHWDLCPLKRVAKIQTGIAKGKTYEDTVDTVMVPYLRVANVQDGYLDLEEMAQIEIPRDSLARYLVKPGDVLMNEGGDFDKLGRGHIWRGEIEPCVHQNHVFVVRPQAITPEWLGYVTSSRHGQSYFTTRAKQSTNLASISSTNLMNLPVPAPELDEQRKIVDFLDTERAKFDALTAEATRAITLLQERRAALISAAVTGKIDVRDITTDNTEAA